MRGMTSLGPMTINMPWSCLKVTNCFFSTILLGQVTNLPIVGGIWDTKTYLPHMANVVDIHQELGVELALIKNGTGPPGTLGNMFSLSRVHSTSTRMVPEIPPSLMYVAHGISIPWNVQEGPGQLGSIYPFQNISHQ
jgi:hypothetical protein